MVSNEVIPANETGHRLSTHWLSREKKMTQYARSIAPFFVLLDEYYIWYGYKQSESDKMKDKKA